MPRRSASGASAVRQQLEMLAQDVAGKVHGRVGTPYALNIGRYGRVIEVGVVTAGDADDLVPAAPGRLAMAMITGRGISHRLLSDKRRSRAMVEHG